MDVSINQPRIFTRETPPPLHNPSLVNRRPPRDIGESSRSREELVMAAFCISTTGAGEFDHRCPRGVSFRNGYFDGGPIHYRWGSATDCGGPPRANSDTRDKSSKRDHNSIKWQYLEHPKSPSALRAIDRRRKKNIQDHSLHPSRYLVRRLTDSVICRHKKMAQLIRG